VRHFSCNADLVIHVLVELHGLALKFPHFAVFIRDGEDVRLGALFQAAGHGVRESIGGSVLRYCDRRQCRRCQLALQWISHLDQADVGDPRRYG